MVKQCDIGPGDCRGCKVSPSLADGCYTYWNMSMACILHNQIWQYKLQNVECMLRYTTKWTKTN